MPSEDLPIDFSNPAVRDYMSLIRLQVLTPLSLLINIVTVAICSLVITPGVGEITKWHPAALSPHTWVIGIYILAIYILQVGYCVILVFVRKPETKATVVKGVGLALVLSNWVMAFWSIAWVLQGFIISTILLGLLVLILFYANLVLIIYHEPTFKRPLDIAFIHAPIRLFFILPFGVLFWYSLSIALGVGQDPAHRDNYTIWQWPAFGILLGVNAVGMLIIAVRRDIVWTVGAAWINVSLWSTSYKPTPVFITAIIFTILHPITLVVSTLYHTFFKKQREGRIRLEEEDDVLRAQLRAEQNGSNEVGADWN
ncbi:unnamed protein product [Peniophora sp. CBMAI 1063]|nr:unnamed protein product [Peniophora sp. CBMAI 1063]